MQDTNEMISRMEQDMRLRGFSASTQNNYRRYARKYLEYCGGDTCEEGIRKYLIHLREEQKLSPGSVNMYNAAIRFLLEVTLDQAVNHKRVPRLREVRSLPKVLSREELRRIFECASPFRNCVILMTLYGGGLRISEVCSLKVTDIDSEQMRIFIRDGKGGKDRYTLLSQANLEALREYWRQYRPKHPEGWLFLNKDGSSHAQKRMIQMALGRALSAAGIEKEVTVHTLRASFATHLLEDGADIFTVKRLMGHSCLRSLASYMGVTKFEASLKSPLDSLPKKRARKPKTSKQSGASHG